jgi:hypothetical protein
VLRYDINSSVSFSLLRYLLQLKSLKGIARLTLTVSLWPEIPRKRKNGNWEYASHTLDGAVLYIYIILFTKLMTCLPLVEIETFASLNVLLHRLLWAKAIDKALASFSLKQNPEFYPKFPNTKKDFRVAKSRSDVHLYIPALYVWDRVERYKGDTLHLIVDRDRSDRKVELENLTKLDLPEIYSNGWYLENDKDLIAVREKGL